MLSSEIEYLSRIIEYSKIFSHFHFINNSLEKKIKGTLKHC